MMKGKEKLSGILEGIYRGLSLTHIIPTAYRKGLHNITKEVEFKRDTKTRYALYTATAILTAGLIGYSSAILNDARNLYILPIGTNIFSLFYELIDKPINEEGKTLQGLIKDKLEDLLDKDDFDKFKWS